MPKSLALELAGWLFFFLSIFAGGRGALAVGVLALAVLNASGLFLAVQNRSEEVTGKGRVARAATMAVGAAGLLFAGLVALLLYVFPVNLITFGLCSADPRSWICALDP